MLDVGLSPTTGGGKRSDASRLKSQMERLFRAHISFEATFLKDGRKGEGRRDMLVTEETLLWWDHWNPRQDTLWKSWIELGEKFYDAITSAPIPVDIRALKALKRSPLALDLYAWLTYEAYRASKSKQSRFVSWELLHQQFGAEYTGDKAVTNFQQAVRWALRKITVVYPDLVLGHKRGGIEVLPSSPPAITSRA